MYGGTRYAPESAVEYRGIAVHCVVVELPSLVLQHVILIARIHSLRGSHGVQRCRATDLAQPRLSTHAQTRIDGAAVVHHEPVTWPITWHEQEQCLRECGQAVAE